MSENLIVADAQMHRIKNNVFIFRIVCIIISVGYFVVLPSSIRYPTNGLVSHMVLIAAIICWANFGSLVGRKNLLLAIASNHMTAVNEIVRNTGKSKKKVIKRLKALLKRRYLPGWKLSSNETELISTSGKVYKCAYCSAPCKPEEKICSYCGGTIRA